tara:strand:+ start:173 stop:787 length:615 start_codon:yes stop_codon:yes gene_type:complete
LIKRTSKNHLNKILSNNPNWKILDVGCGYNANKYATTVCDILDLSSIYTDKNFVKLEDKKFPFKDKEFDFVIASHVLEHVEDVSYFIKELERISLKGYIEVPTKLEDNLVFENKKAHIWHLTFDDIENQLIINKKFQYFEPILTVGSIKNFNNYFRESLVIELNWEESIEYKIENKELSNSDKISIFTLFKKYFSKKLRMFFSK